MSKVYVAVATYQPGQWFEAQSIDEMEAFYRSRLPAMREAAREHGYALGLHGSVRRDMDIIAMPWREAASDKNTLVHALARAACGLSRTTDYNWEKKPAGRVATSFPICTTTWFDMISAGHVDISILEPMSPALIPGGLQPCPFCGAAPVFPEAKDVHGTCYEGGCEECGLASVSLQIIDCFDHPRKHVHDSWDNTDHRYSNEYIEVARQLAIRRWSTRISVPPPARPWTAALPDELMPLFTTEREEQLVEVLKFYAEPKNYEDNSRDRDDGSVDDYPPVVLFEDRGAKAREALKAIGHDLGKA